MMSYTFKLQSRLFVIMMLSYSPSSAFPAHSLNLSAMTKDSSLIVVGKILSVQHVGEGVLTRRGGSIPVLNKVGKIQVNRILKGHTSESTITFEFVQTVQWYGIADVRVAQIGMFFLKPNGKNGFTVTSYYFPFVVAALVAPKTAGSDFERVLAEVTNVLALPQTTWVDKIKAIDILERIEAPGSSESLRMAAKSENVRVKLSAIMALLRRNDISELGVVEEMLSQPPRGSDPDFIDNLAHALHGVKDPKAIPTLVRLLKSRYVEVRRSSALALRGIRSDATINPFAKALYDSDRDVRYHAVMGLAEMTKQYSWAPAMDIYYSNEQHYLTYWRNWAAKR